MNPITVREVENLIQSREAVLARKLALISELQAEVTALQQAIETNYKWIEEIQQEVEV
jgi:hypothetical protein